MYYYMTLELTMMEYDYTILGVPICWYAGARFCFAFVHSCRRVTQYPYARTSANALFTLLLLCCFVESVTKQEQMCLTLQLLCVLVNLNRYYGLPLSGFQVGQGDLTFSTGGSGGLLKTNRRSLNLLLILSFAYWLGLQTLPVNKTQFSVTTWFIFLYRENPWYTCFVAQQTDLCAFS
jgi:hypothetical protein